MRFTPTDRYQSKVILFSSFPHFPPLPPVVEHALKADVPGANPSPAEITTDRNENRGAMHDPKSSEDMIIKKTQPIESPINSMTPSPLIEISSSIDMTRESAYSSSDMACTGVSSFGHEATGGGTAHGLKSAKEVETTQETVGTTPAANESMSSSPHIKIPSWVDVIRGPPRALSGSANYLEPLTFWGYGNLKERVPSFRKVGGSTTGAQENVVSPTNPRNIMNILEGNQLGTMKREELERESSAFLTWVSTSASQRHIRVYCMCTPYFTLI